MNRSEVAALDKGAKWAILMLAAQSGDEVSYRTLLQELGTYLKSFLQKRFGSNPYIDDIIQETLLGVHRARHTFDASRPFLPWLHAIVRYKSIDCLRQNKRIQDFEILDEAAFDQFSETFSAEIPNQTMDEDILRALAALPPKQRKAVELMKLEGLTAKEASARLGMSESAVKVSAHRAFESLRRRFLGEKK